MEVLHLPGYPVIAAMLRDMIKVAYRVVLEVC
jgi:hypothetical protein